MTLEKQPLGILCINMSIEKVEMRRCNLQGNSAKRSGLVSGFSGLKRMDMNSKSVRSNKLKLKGSQGQN